MAVFYPLRGEELVLANQTMSDGQFLVATDTGRLFVDYVDENGELKRASIGGSGAGNSGIYYANRTIIGDEKTATEITFLKKEIEGNSYPNEDDLIINIKEGALYRVTKVEQNWSQVTAARLTIAGSGGGSALAEDISLQVEDLAYSTFINGQEDVKIYFTPKSAKNNKGENIDSTVTITWSLSINEGSGYGTPYKTETINDVKVDTRTYIDVSPYLRDSSSHQLVISASQANSDSTYTRKVQFTTTALSLTFNDGFSAITPKMASTADFEIRVTGKVNKKITYYFDGEEKYSEVINADTSETVIHKTLAYTTDNKGLGCVVTHGYHTLKITMSQIFSNGEIGASVPALETEIITYELGETKPIICLGKYKTEFYTYETIQIPYTIYDPNAISTNETKVRFYKKGKELSSQSPLILDTKSLAEKYAIFEIADAAEDGLNEYSIACGEGENRVSRTIKFTVGQDPARITYKIQETNLRYELNTVGSGRSNAESKKGRSTLIYPSDNEGTEETISAKFENFNWLSNGWIKDEAGKTCLRISNGAKLTIPLGKLQFGIGNNNNYPSHTIEFGFKIRNIQDYSNLIKTISRYADDDEYYFQFYDYEYTLATSYDSTITYYQLDPKISWKYVETNAGTVTADNYTLYYTRSDSKIYKTKYTNYDSFLTWYFTNHDTNGKTLDELTANFKNSEKQIDLSNIVCGYYTGDTTSVTGICIGPQDAFFSNGQNTVNVSFVEDEFITLTFVYDNNSKLIYIYLNGMLTSVISSTVEAFSITNENLIFNSEHCDIDLYKLRVYDTVLDVNQIVTHYAVDTNNLDVYDQNLQLTEKNDTINEWLFSYSKMIDYNVNHPTEPLMPYIIFDTTNSNSNNKLPFSKLEDRVISVEFVNTALDAKYASGELLTIAIKDWKDKNPSKDATTLSDAEKNDIVKDYYKHHCPSWYGDKVNIGVQGTSSEFYPRRNYKLKLKNSHDLIHDTETENNNQKENELYSNTVFHKATEVYEDAVHLFLNRGPFLEDYNHDMNGLTQPEYILATGAYDKTATYYTDENGENQISFEVETGNKYESDTYYRNNPDYVKFGKEKTRQKYFYMDNDTCGTTKFTMKIDFMESSGSYNMGFANLVKHVYTKHPLDDLSKNKALCTKKLGDAKIAENYDPNTTYLYVNHKGNLKNASELFKINSETDFKSGPYGLALKSTDTDCAKVLGGTGKALPAIVNLEELTEDEKTTLQENITEKAEEGSQYSNFTYWNHWLSSEISYPSYTIEDTNDYRTSVQGYRVLAFHKMGTPGSSEATYKYIGMYNMLIDKGSDECYGFKPDKTTGDDILQRYININGDHPEIKDIVECWEFENNSRTYCSFRDPLKRKDLSFNYSDDTGTPVASSTKSGPKVMDSFEYRYCNGDDLLDYIANFSNNSDKLHSDTAVEYMRAKNIDITYGGDNDSEAARNARYEFVFNKMANWEKACQWVWSTCTDVVPSMGSYQVVTPGNTPYAANTYFVLGEGTDGKPAYIKDTGTAFDSSQTYYEERYIMEYDEENQRQYDDIPANEKYRQIVYSKIALYDDTDTTKSLAYDKNKFYVKINDLYILSADDFDQNTTYYQLIETDAEIFENKAETNEYAADRLVKKCAEYNENIPLTDYYTYDGTKKPGYAVCRVDPNEITDIKTQCVNYYIPAPESNFGDGKTYNYDTKEYRLAKFKAELSKHFDLEYMAAYFVMTEVFECYDSRGKNCMMASWGPQSEGGDYIWYPIFYDIDTQLGINNTGIPSFEYNVDATIDGNYSTSDSVLWNNFYIVFKSSDILQEYRYLRGTAAYGSSATALGESAPLRNVDNIEDQYNTNPLATNSIAMEGVRPLIAKNLDEYYKYINITKNINNSISTGQTGYLNSNGTYVQDSGCTYFYALQGDRSLSRRQFLTNRLDYIDSWLNEGEYQRGHSANLIRGRIAANNSSKTSDEWVVSAGKPYFADANNLVKAHLFDAEYWVDFEATHSCYLTLGDDNEAYPSQKYDGISPLRFIITSIQNGVQNSANYPEQLLYIYGIKHLTNLGSMYNLYWQEFSLEGSAPHLTSLLLGFDGTYEEDGISKQWFNKNVNAMNLHADTEGNSLPLLKELNMSNIQINDAATGGKTLNLSGCEKLENFRATGSNYEEIIFADGVALHTLYLPSTIQKLKLSQARLLTKLLTTYTTPTYDSKTKTLTAEPGLYIEGFYSTAEGGLASTKITNLNIAGGGLGYDSYKFLEQFYKLCKDDKDTSRAISLTDVEWTPYSLISDVDVLLSEEHYYKDNGHCGLEPIDSADLTSATIQAAIANGEVYIYNGDLESSMSTITDITLLEALATNAIFTAGTENSCPEITGYVYVNNDEYTQVKTGAVINTTRNNYYKKTGTTYEVYTPSDENNWETDIAMGAIYSRLRESYIRNELLAKYYPKLKIFFTNIDAAYTAKFVLLNEDDINVYDEIYLETTIEYSEDGYFTNPFEDSTTFGKVEYARDHCTFKGWKLRTDGSEDLSQDKELIEASDDWGKLRLDKDKHNYIFYAYYEPNTYTCSIVHLKSDAQSRTTIVSRFTYSEILREKMLYGFGKNPTNSSTLQRGIFGLTGKTAMFPSTTTEAYQDGKKKRYEFVGYRELPANLNWDNFTNYSNHPEEFEVDNDNDLLVRWTSYSNEPHLTKNVTIIPAIRLMDVDQDTYSHYPSVLEDGSNGVNVYYDMLFDNKKMACLDYTYGAPALLTDIYVVPSAFHTSVNSKATLTTVQAVGSEEAATSNADDSSFRNFMGDAASKMKVVYFAKDSKVTTIRRRAFANLNALEAVYLPSTITSIEEEAFKDCTALKSLTIGDEDHRIALENIGNNAFSGLGEDASLILYISNSSVSSDFATKIGFTGNITYYQP